MNNEKRAALAFVCGNRYRGIIATRLYDHSRNKYLSYNLQKDASGFNMFDYDRNSYLNGNENQLFDFFTKSYIQIYFNEQLFSGFDFQSSTSFYGIINGNLISIYDHQFGKYFNYIVL